MSDMKKIFVIILTFTLIVYANCQNYHFALQTGTGNYSMKELKEFNGDILNGLPFNAKLVENFPAYWTYKVYFGLVGEKQAVSVFSGFQSTGSRISARDYTGEYKLDMHIKAKSYGVHYDRRFWHNHFLELRYYAEMSQLKTNLNIDEYFNLFGDDIFSQSYTFKSENYSLDSGLMFGLYTNNIKASFNIGFNVDLGNGKFNSDDRRVSLVEKITYDRLKPHWGGLRISTTFLLALPK